MRSTLSTLLLLFASLQAALAADPPAPPAVDAADRAAILEEIVTALEETYIFADTAEEMAAHVRQRLASGAYDAAVDLVAFTERLTEDLRQVSRDRHLSVRWDPRRPEHTGEGPSAEERRARYAEFLRRRNHCFERLEHLQGNVGYLKLDCFAPAELGGRTAVAAMNYLSASDALIFDLRDNSGGNPSMIQLLTSYLFDEPTHLNSFYVRKTDSTEQFWTQAWVEGPKLTDVPVWVLTGERTFSAGEEFAYNLRALERATLVGETTGGGAHPVESYRLEDYPVILALPYGRAVNPITGTNWEGTGVEPHHAVPADEALAAAHQRALAHLLEAADDPERRTFLEFAHETLALRRAAPVALTTAELDQYVGTYGPRTIARRGSDLVYRRGDGPETVLVPAGDDRFLYGEADDFRIRFERDADGSVVRIVGVYADGREDAHGRE